MRYPNTIYCANLSTPENIYSKYFYNENNAIFWICRQMQSRSKENLSIIMDNLLKNKEFSLSAEDKICYEGWVSCINIEE